MGGSEKWETRAPVGFAKYHGSAAQLWSVAPAGPSGNASNGKLLDANDNQCLNVVAFTGPDVGLDPCKPAGSGNDGNEIFELKESSLPSEDSSLGSFTITNGGKCLAASAGPAGGYLYTVDAAGAEWCLMSDGGKGSRSTTMSGQPCAEVEAASATPAWQPGKVANGTVASLSFSGGSNTLTWGNRQMGASGPLPHHIYLHTDPYGGGGPAWRWPDALATPAGATLQLPGGTNLTLDDHVGGVTHVDSSTMCAALTRGGNLEVWAGALSGHRLAVAFFNRGYQTAAVRSRSPLSLLRTARSNSGARRR